MRLFWALIRKQLHESRWTLGVSASALFGLGWLSVYVTSLNESRIVQALGSGGGGDRIEWMRRLGIANEPTSAELMMAFWNHPFFLILISIWAISRGSGAVAAEVERGTMDLLLSRPISRTTYLASQVVVAMMGLVFLDLCLTAGSSLAVRYNTLRDAARPLALVSAGHQPGRAGATDLRLHAAGFIDRPRAMAADVDRLEPDARRLHRLRDRDAPGLQRGMVEAMGGACLDLQGL